MERREERATAAVVEVDNRRAPFRDVRSAQGPVWVEEAGDAVYLVFARHDAAVPFGSVVGFGRRDGGTTRFSWATAKRSAIASSLSAAVEAVAGTIPRASRHARDR